MSTINNFNVLPFYTSLSKQNSKKWYSFGNIYPLASPKDKILPFQIVMASIVSTVSSITIHNQKTGATISSGLTPTIFTPEGGNYSIVYLKLSSISSLQEGRYYLSFSIDGITMYSEIFNAISDLSEYVKLEYWNEDDLYNRDKIQVYFGNDFRFTMYICTDIGKPEYIFEEELTKRLGYKFLESQISNKLYKFTFLAPEYMTDSMRIIRLCDFIKLTQSNEEYNALNFAYDAKWEQQGDLASVECEFETDTIIQKLQSFNRRQQQSFYNALLSNIDEPILFDTEVVAQYYADFQTGVLVQGKLIHELELETELKPGAFIPIDNNDGTPAKKISVTTLTSSSHSHENKTLLDLITQGNIDVLSHLSIMGGRLKADVDFYSTGEVSAYGAGTGTGVGAVDSLGGLANVGIWADEVPASDRIMIQLAGATHWSSMLLSEIVGLDTVALGAYLTTNNYATQSYVSTKIAELVGTAPTTLDTLNELAAALGNDPNFATSMSTLIGTKWTQDNTKIANWDSAYSALHSHPNKSIIDSLTQANLDVLSKLSIVDGNLKVDTNLWSTGEVSAYGAGSGTGGGGTGLITSVLGSSGLGGSYLDSDLTNTFNAYTINLINTNLTSALGRIGALETSTPNVAWGTPTSQYSPLTINSVTRNLSVDGHTHSYLPLSGGIMNGSIAMANNILSLSSLSDNQTDGSPWYGLKILADSYVKLSGYFGLRLKTFSNQLEIPNTGDLTYNSNKVWHAGNDGAGSGLDADLLDGLQSDFFRNRYSATIKKGVWSRILYATPIALFGSFILTIQHTRNSVVVGNVFLVTFGHNSHGQITVLGTHGYTQIQARLTGDLNNIYFEVFDDGAGALGELQTTIITLDNVNANVTPYTSFTDGSVLSGTEKSIVSTVYNRINVDGSTVAFLTDNVASATKLANTRTIWGQSFNGEGDVSGAINNATTGTFSSYITANRFYTGYDSGVANSFSCSNWFRSNGATGWYNDTYGAGINSDTANVVRTYSTNKFKVYNTESDSISTLGGIKLWNGTKSVTLTVDESGNLKVDGNMYSTGEISAYGAGSGSGGGGGLITSVLGSAGLGGSYLDSDLTNTFNAYTINLINTNLTSALGRIGALETSTPNISWGTPTSQYSPLTINSVTRNLSVDGHTHSSFLDLELKNIQGGDSNHRLELGYTARDYVNWYEYGGLWKFIQRQNGFDTELFQINTTNILYRGNAVWHAGNSNISTVDWAVKNLTMSEGRIITPNYLQVNTDFGYAQFGPQNPSHCHIYTDRPSFYFNKDILINGNSVWHSGNDGAGSGLDADLIDGINSNNIVYGTNGYACNSINNADFNTINKSGLYTIYMGVNSPSGSNQDKAYSLLSILEGSLTGSQLAYSFYGSDSGKLYARGLLGGNFSAWRTVAFEDSNVASATNISNTGTVNLASATESNSITITAPSYTSDKPVKLLNFNWYSDAWSIGNIRSGNSASNGLGIYLNSVEKFRFSDGTFKVGNSVVWHSGNDGAGSGLDAGLLCGRDNSYYFKTRGAYFANINDASLINSNSTCYWTPTTLGHPNGDYGYGVLLNVSDEIGWYNQLGFGTDNNIYFRQSINSATNFGAWRTVAFEDSNVASATKLANTRYLWGNAFTGESDISGGIVINKSSSDTSEGQQSLVILSGVNDSKLQMGAIPNVGSYIQSMRHVYDWTSRPLLLQPNGGNVGIGTSSPSNKLTVKSQSSGLLENQAIKWENDTLVLGYIGSDSNAYNSGAIRLSVNGVADQTVISANGNSWLNGGNVGIGTTSPSFKLDVSGTARATRFVSGYDPGADDSFSCGNWFRSAGDSGWYSGTYGGGIYMTDSTYVKIYNNKSFWVNGNIVATGEVTAYSASDLRLKTEVASLKDSLSIIELLNPVSYKWNSIAKELNPMKGDEKDYGLIAQELESVMPELVHTVYGQYKSVDYMKLIPHLICAIKQLKMEIDMLKS